MKAGAAYPLLATLVLAACEPVATADTATGPGLGAGTVLEAGGVRMRVTRGETITALADGPLTLLSVTRADGRATRPTDEAAARAIYAAYCADRGGVGIGGEGYFSQFGDWPSWKFGECGA